MKAKVEILSKLFLHEIEVFHWVWFWFDFCFMALQHFLGHFGCGQLT